MFAQKRRAGCDKDFFLIVARNFRRRTKCRNPRTFATIVRTFGGRNRPRNIASGELYTVLPRPYDYASFARGLGSSSEERHSERSCVDSYVASRPRSRNRRVGITDQLQGTGRKTLGECWTTPHRRDQRDAPLSAFSHRFY